MGEIRKYYLPSTALIPNSLKPVLHYRHLFAKAECNASDIHELFSRNGWQTQWIRRYGPTQTSHYHSQTHECMAVLSGSATIRFGVADMSSDTGTDTSLKEGGCIEVTAEVGDVFIIPAGVSHKTFDAVPASEMKLLTPGDGHHIDAEDLIKALKDIEISGFTMLGAYPQGCVWDFAVDGQHCRRFEEIWSVPKPDSDPVFRHAESGLCGLWK